MTIFRYKHNGLLYTITIDNYGRGFKAHPYLHESEIGIQYTSKNRYRNFKSNMSMSDFVVVSEK